jgi:hypothetical protein
VGTLDGRTEFRNPYNDQLAFAGVQNSAVHTLRSSL